MNLKRRRIATPPSLPSRPCKCFLYLHSRTGVVWKRMSFESKNVVGGGFQPESSWSVDHELLLTGISSSPDRMLSPAVRPDSQPSMELLIPGSCNEIYTYESRIFQLRFSHGISSPVMTGKKIKGEGCQVITVVLFDDSGNEIVSGHEAFGEVEIVVLQEIFVSVRADNWMPEEFDENIVTGWKYKKSPLAGEIILKLNDGIGILNDIRFTHDRRWVSKTKCRLGARAVDKNNRLRVREAITEPFELKDCRLEWNGKHCSPSLLDDVWRLKQIARDGPRDSNLREANIKTVKDFLIQLFLNPRKLQKIYGGAGKNWEGTVRHARTCADKMVCYASNSRQQSGVVVNASGEVLGLRFECKFVHVDKLSDAEKALAHKAVISAFEHPENVVVLSNNIDDDKDFVHGSDPNDLPCASNPSNPRDFGVENLVDGHADQMQPSTSTRQHIFSESNTELYRPQASVIGDLFPDHGLMHNEEYFDSESYLQNESWRFQESYDDLGLGCECDDLAAGNQRNANNEYEAMSDVGAAGTIGRAHQRRGKKLWRVWSNAWFFVKKMGEVEAGVHAKKRLRLC